MAHFQRTIPGFARGERKTMYMLGRIAVSYFRVPNKYVVGMFTTYCFFF